MVVADVDRMTLGQHVNEPTEEERHTLRRVTGRIPPIAYLICFVEFAERASYYGVQPLIGNFVNRSVKSALEKLHFLRSCPRALASRPLKTFDKSTY